MEYVSTGDLVIRWGYTRQGVNQLARKPDFPPPAFRINGGRLPVWELSALAEYENARPELTSEVAKFRKRNGYYAAIQKGRRGEPRTG